MEKVMDRFKAPQQSKLSSKITKIAFGVAVVTKYNDKEQYLILCCN